MLTARTWKLLLKVAKKFWLQNSPQVNFCLRQILIALVLSESCDFSGESICLEAVNVCYKILCQGPNDPNVEFLCTQ